MTLREPRKKQGRMHFSSIGKPVTMRRWKTYTICATRTYSLAWIPLPRCMAIRASPRPLFCPCADAEKNGLWPVRRCACGLLRSTAAFDSRPFLWRQTRLSFVERPACRLLVLRQSQDRTPPVDFRTSRLHQTVRLLGRTTLSRYPRESGGRGVGPGLADGQGVGQALYARATSSRSTGQSHGHRHRRDLHGQRTEVSHRGERPPLGPAHLVRRQGSFGSQPRRVLCVARSGEIQGNSLSRHGYVESVSQIDTQARQCAASENPVRQVSCGGSSPEGDGPGSQKRVCPLERQGSAIHQRPALHVAGAQTQPYPPRKKGLEATVGCEQTAQHGLHSEGAIRAVVGVQNGGLGPSLFRALAGRAQMAASQAVSEIRGDDRQTLGRHRGSLRGREPGDVRLRGRFQQQDPRDPTTRVWLTRRGVPAPENLKLHAAKNR